MIEFIRGFARGLSEKQIAIDMKCAFQTVGTHKSRVRERLGLFGANDVDLAVWCIKNGYLHI
jgi:DNA-binding NarL/FixJ family response regulator